MKNVSISLSTKIWLAIVASIFITVVFSYLLSNLFYEKLYVENMEKSLFEAGKRLSYDYEGGPLTEEFKENIEWYSTKSEFEAFAVSNPRELSACLPFEVDYQTLISPEEREELLQGYAVRKMGHEERFDRNIIAVIIPLLDGNRLEGIIYIYLPLARITELTKDFSYLWLICAVLFLVIALYLGTLLVRKLTRPLQQIKKAAEEVSVGNYTVAVPHYSDDEVGQLASAFNHMATSIQKEDERKKEFLANVSHELRTPLSYIHGYSEALASGLVKKEKDKEKYLSLIYREAKRMERLVGDLLDLAKLDSDDYSLVRMPLSLAQLVIDATQKYIITLKEKGIKLSFDLDPDIIVYADEGRIEQVLQNMTDNAMKYTDEGEITFVLARDPLGCRLTIKDTGKGIPKEDLQHIKERFYRVNKARTRSDGGTGLGLAISEKIIKLHEGQIMIESELGKGTKVDIILPTYNNE